MTEEELPELEEELPEAEEASPESGETKNQVDGDNSGTVYQIRDVHGNIVHVENLNVVTPPAPTPPPVPTPQPELAPRPEPPQSPIRQLLPFVPHLIVAVLFGSLASILVVYHQSLLFRVLAVLAALAPFVLLAVLSRRKQLIERCTPKVLRDAQSPALAALAVLTLLLTAAVLAWPPSLWDGYPQRDGIVLALLFTDIAALSILRVVRRSHKK
ncbi:hypothetical protein [Kutzneria sp. CA-103260]|uniref:hypothetical protein n=1 Tax=Kutzneria sp. CA-103260 TaxID=2802641 RepID=UPI001BA9EBA0|nr:hypothetical protein [Kutzneria sp. CA-103260]QUQ71429.1 hypothetical protein JJ691_92160 [Kutzneria sp. CA-103260]